MNIWNDWQELVKAVQAHGGVARYFLGKKSVDICQTRHLMRREKLLKNFFFNLAQISQVPPLNYFAESPRFQLVSRK